MKRRVLLRGLFISCLLAMMVIGLFSGLSRQTAIRNLIDNYDSLNKDQRQSLLEKCPPSWIQEDGELQHWNFGSLHIDPNLLQSEEVGNIKMYYQIGQNSLTLILTILFLLFAYFFLNHQLRLSSKGFIKYKLVKTAVVVLGGLVLITLLSSPLKWLGIDPKLWIVLWAMMSLMIISLQLYQIQWMPQGYSPLVRALGVLSLIVIFASYWWVKDVIYTSIPVGVIQLQSWLGAAITTSAIFGVSLLIVKILHPVVQKPVQRIGYYCVVAGVILILWLTQSTWQLAFIFGIATWMMLILMDLTIEEKRLNFLWLTVWIVAIGLFITLFWWSQQTQLVGIIDLFNYFSLSFVGILVISVGVVLIPRFLPLGIYRFNNTITLRQKVEMLVLGTLFISFITIGSITYTLEKSRSNKLIEEQLNSIQYGAPSEYILQDEFEIVRFNDDVLEVDSRNIPKHWDLPKFSVWYNSEVNTRPFIDDGIAYWRERGGELAIFRPIQQSFFASFGQSLISKLFNLYVFLFILCVGAVYLLTQSITRPLIFLGDQLEKISLGKSNPRIEWKSRDEVGSLIERYNAMLDQLDHSAEALANTERDQAWREMAKQVAHEIKNPLTPMKLSIQYLQMKAQGQDGPLPDQVKKTSQTLIEQIDNMTRIAENFSQFGALPQVSNQRVLLNEVVTSVHDLFRKREDMNIKCRVPIDDCFVFADKDHLIRIFNNIIKNAIQAIPHDRKGEIIIKLERMEHHAMVSISDNGEGIPDERIKKIFQPNFTTKRSGTGLGLAMCSKMIDSMDGRIYFETEVGEGTTFFVEIPLLRIEENYSEEEVTL